MKGFPDGSIAFPPVIVSLNQVTGYLRRLVPAQSRDRLNPCRVRQNREELGVVRTLSRVRERAKERKGNSACGNTAERPRAPDHALRLPLYGQTGWWRSMT